MKGPIVPFVNSKSRPMKSFYGAAQQRAVAVKTAVRSAKELRKKFFTMESGNPLNHRFYGKINHFGIPVVPLNEGVFDSVSSTTAPVVCLDFVAEAFNSYKSVFDNTMSISNAVQSVGGMCTMREFNDTLGTISGITEEKMRAKKGWTSAHLLHANYLNGEPLELLRRYTKENEQSIMSIGDYMQMFLRFCREFCMEINLSFTSFVLSPKTPHHCTGLFLDLMTEDPNDMRKVVNLLNEPGFSSLVQIMNNSGFKCNLHSPWTMAADLSSPVMRRYMAEKGVNTPEQMFDQYYIETHTIDYKKLQDLILDGYLRFLAENQMIVTKKYCADGSVRSITREVRPDVGKSGRQLRSEMNPGFLLEVYVEIRGQELPNMIPRSAVEKIYDISSRKIKDGDSSEAFKDANKRLLDLDERFAELKGVSGYENNLLLSNSFATMKEEFKEGAYSAFNSAKQALSGTPSGTGGGGSTGGGASGGSSGGSSGGY